ncbi:MAG: hypothetical protein U5J78_00380 [Parasphingorhabdus sp.]|nr:hypothetical protein [Parasphingorhabdus sp.]
MIDTLALLAVPSEVVAAAKAFLRIDHNAEDQFIAEAATTAARLCEEYIAQLLIIRSVSEIITASGDWCRLSQTPVRTITSVEALAVDGTRTLIAAENYAIDIDSNGFGWIRTSSDGGRVRLAVGYDAGISAAWSDIDAALIQGIIRLVAHIYSHRDADDGGAPPSAVTALWRPFRRMRLA